MCGDCWFNGLCRRFLLLISLNRVNKKNGADDDVSGDKEKLSIEYVDTTRFSTKSQRRQMKMSSYVCKFCKRRLGHQHELNTHILKNHSKNL
jgi:hypothetical protein